MKLDKIKTRFLKFIDDIDRHEIFILAGSIAYTTALALAPFMLILLSLASLLGPDLQEKIAIHVAEAIGEKAGQTIFDIVENTKKNSSFSGFSGIIGFLVLLVSASAIFSQLRNALNKINDHANAKDKSGFMIFIRNRFFSMGLVFGFSFLSIVSMLVSTGIALIFPAENGGIFWEGVSIAINLVIFTALFTCIYKVIPTDNLGWKRCRVSGFVSAIFYLIGKILISLYLAHAGIESSYGAAGSIIAFLVWVYYTSMILLISYEFTTDIVSNKDQ